MRRSELVIGGEYIAKVSGTLTRVRLESIRDTTMGPRFYAVNLSTNRQLVWRSAQKFRRPARQIGSAVAPVSTARSAAAYCLIIED